MTIKGIAHRGYPVKYIENTLPSFQAACELGFSQLELDVHLSKDGVPIVMHDKTLDRLSDGKGYIKDYTAEELRQFRISGTEVIPTLEEALLLVKDRLIVSIELKQEGELYTGLEEAVLEVVRRTGMIEQVYVISFDHFSVARMRELDADIPLGLVFHGSMPYVFPFMKEIKGQYLAVKLSFLTERYARMIEEAGIQLVVWPVDRLDEMEMVAKKYPSAIICTNELERWKSFVENRS
ncbi:glycerophosphodiester phosphodiesterase family protein [Paenibacillus qinlingensis]|uniref:Glycerophosphoryl diester phosphodiesterase n=1 Tax=Paenibacillus qinlingensis TaxID=1837343 RepID=A0ABU1NX01_9BACL|nr:glycerophosphodiester phosphodiesterase family protein [Paenibacillus qinlingensis]MDR6552013.1 glycerophosphoryl diester phosphodiesterase [Paenibacillus qinlingensis]